jgi:hypothetical protein
MNTKTVLATSCTLLAIALAAEVHAGDASAGANRATQGAKDAVSAPLQVVEGISKETDAHGAVGVITGSVKGGASAAGQLVTGAVNVGVGIVEVLTSPLMKD